MLQSRRCKPFSSSVIVREDRSKCSDQGKREATTRGTRSTKAELLLCLLWLLHCVDAGLTEFLIIGWKRAAATHRGNGLSILDDWQTALPNRDFPGARCRS